METDFPFACFDTEDSSKELGARIRRGDKTASFFDKKVTQIAAITAQGEHFYNKGDVKQFLQVVQRLADQKGITYWYALNIQYDLGNLFSKTLDQLDCTLVGGRMIKAKLGKVTFVDVWNLWQMSVKRLGDVFDLKKLETESMSEDKAYVFRDVEIIREAMLYVWKFAAELGIDEVPPTLGSLGVRLWKHWGGETVHESGEICRDAIFGGRVEIFKTGNANKSDASTVAYTDINSLYPFAMTKKFPGVLEDTGQQIKEYGLVQATVNVPKCEIAVLPYRNEKGKIYYPYGKFTGVWTVPELRAAEQAGAKIEKVHLCYTTDEAIQPYKTYVERIYQLRLDSKSKVEKTFYKLLMNTLFGRTGSTGRIGRTVYQTKKNKHIGVPYGERVLINYPMPLSEEVNWSHTAYITSYGRLELLKHLQIIGAENLIYCDTDSTIFDCPGKIPFPTGSELGQMKVETTEQGKDRWDIAIPWAPKQYRLNDEYKAKGVPRTLQCLTCKTAQQKSDAVKCESCGSTDLQSFQKTFIETGMAEYDMPFKFREAVRFYDVFDAKGRKREKANAKELSVWRTIEKHNNANYDKKTLIGNRFYPCKITDV